MSKTNDIVNKLRSSGYFLVGSRAFFTGMKNFQPHDYDLCKIVNKGKGFNYYRFYHSDGICKNEVVKMPVEDFCKFAIEEGSVKSILSVGGFLTPEFARQYGFYFNKEHKILEPLLNKLDRKHQYYKYIYDAYLENGSMTLTDEQRELAYRSYTLSRRM